MTWDALIHWAAVIGGLSVCALAAITVVCVAFAERNAVPVQDDQFTPEEKIPEGVHGVYEEPEHVRFKRECFSARRSMTAHEIEVAEHRRALATRKQ